MKTWENCKDLLPCPCCGGGAHFKLSYIGTKHYQAHCGSCSLSGGCYDNKQAAIITWNKRTPLPEPPKHITHAEPDVCTCGHTRKQHSFFEDHDECDYCYCETGFTPVS